MTSQEQMESPSEYLLSVGGWADHLETVLDRARADGVEVDITDYSLYLKRGNGSYVKVDVDG